jgi:hypothetical protein
MQAKLLKSLQAVALAGTVVIATGCTVSSTTGTGANPLDEVREIANEALRTANTAGYNASVAKEMALGAQETADLAVELATMAQDTADANTRRSNVMFHDTMKSK